VILAAGQGAFLYLLGPAIRRFPKERWPLRVLSMTGPETESAVRDARADVGVAVVGSPSADLECTQLRQLGQLVVLPKAHRLARRRKLSPADLDGEQIIVAPEGSPHRVMLSQALATAGARWSVAVEATGWELMMQFARYGLGIAVVNDFCPVPRGFAGVRLEGVPNVAYSLLVRPGSPKAATEALIRVIRETASG
jgi:DNA-binding transcriptional LysR family regulator